MKSIQSLLQVTRCVLPGRTALAGYALGFWLALGAAGSASAQGPVVLTDHSTYLPGEDIIVTFANGPGNRLDWIGIYPEGIVPGSVGSTRWFYVDNTQGGNQSFVDGAVTFTGGLNLAGDWVAFLLLNDGYTVLAQRAFKVVDPAAPLVRTAKRVYAPGESITVTFSNGPGNAKDWIGIYLANQTPGAIPSLLWNYVDGTQVGATGLAEGSMTFAGGLGNPGDYAAHLLLNDGYDVLASELFSVVQPTASKPRFLSVQPANNATNMSPLLDFRAAITNGTSKVVSNSVVLKIDGMKVTHVYAQQDELVTVSYAGTTMLAANSAHTFELTFVDDATPANALTNTARFTIANYLNITLPAPLYFENFDSTPEGQLPTGWTETNYTEVTNPELDLGNLDSASYATWTVVNVDRFKGSFVTYSDPANPDDWETDYQRVLTPNPVNVVNGQLVTDLAQGRMLFGDSGYRNGRSQVLYAFSPDFDLTGKTDVYLSFHSLWEQNQDSTAAVEYSIDQGQTWLPVVYMVDGADVIKDQDGKVDAVATLTTERGDAARYTDPVSGEEKGGFYGAFIGATVSQDLAPFISARVNDDPSESKRVELFRLAQADNQAKVRFRFAHAGTDSWYFGIDDFGLYSIAAVEPPVIQVQPADLAVTVGNDGALVVQAGGTPPLSYQWFHNGQPVDGGTNATLPLSAVQSAQAGSYYVRVTNAGGSRDSATVTVTIKLPITGVWNFDQGDLSTSTGVGLLEYADGAATQGLTKFETTDGSTVPHINGQPAKFMRVPAFTAGANGYSLTMPGLAPNGGGAYVNQYTMIWDVLLPGALNWMPFFNTAPANGNDADFYVSDAGALGIGALGYSAAGAVQSDTWYRIAFVANLGAGKVSYYVNGDPVRDRTGGSLRDGRFALYSDLDAGPDLRLFNEGDTSGVYTHEVLVNSFLFTDHTMSASEIKALGGPSAAGIPSGLSAPLTVTASLQGAALTLSWSGGAGPYQVQKAASLINPQWQNVGAPTTNTQITEPVGGAAAFYRVAGQ